MSNSALPIVLLVRHGETEWSLSGQHTGKTDIPLTTNGERIAVALGERLRAFRIDQVFTSPRSRARRTCELAGLGDIAVVDDVLAEWDYGDYEGLRTAEIRAKRDGWVVFRDGAPGGESPQDVSRRADRVIAKLRSVEGNTALFTHGHFGRVLAARWLGLDVAEGAKLLLDAGSLSLLSYDHSRDEPAIKRWNDTTHIV